MEKKYNVRMVRKMFKYIKLLLQWKDIRKIYREEYGKKKPWYASRRFVGLIILFIGAILKTFFDIYLPPETIESLTDNAVLVGTVIDTIIPALVSIYGAITYIIGQVKKSAKGEIDG